MMEGAEMLSTSELYINSALTEMYKGKFSRTEEGVYLYGTLIMAGREVVEGNRVGGMSDLWQTADEMIEGGQEEGSFSFGKPVASLLKPLRSVRVTLESGQKLFCIETNFPLPPTEIGNIFPSGDEKAKEYKMKADRISISDDKRHHRKQREFRIHVNHGIAGSVLTTGIEGLYFASAKDLCPLPLLIVDDGVGPALVELLDPKGEFLTTYPRASLLDWQRPFRSYLGWFLGDVRHLIVHGAPLKSREGRKARLALDLLRFLADQYTSPYVDRIRGNVVSTILEEASPLGFPYKAEQDPMNISSSAANALGEEAKQLREISGFIGRQEIRRIEEEMETLVQQVHYLSQCLLGRFVSEQVIRLVRDNLREKSRKLYMKRCFPNVNRAARMLEKVSKTRKITSAQAGLVGAVLRYDLRDLAVVLK